MSDVKCTHCVRGWEPEPSPPGVPCSKCKGMGTINMNVWKCRDCSGTGYRPEHEATCATCHGVGMVSAYQLNQLREQNDLLTKQVESLAAFKTFVHDFLDRKGIDRDPPGEHRDVGCRIGQRLELVFARWTGDRVEFEEFMAAYASVLEWEPAVKAHAKGEHIDPSALKARLASFMRDYKRLTKAADATQRENDELRNANQTFREVALEFLRMVPKCTREWVMFDGVVSCEEAQKRAAQDYTMLPAVRKSINQRQCLHCRVKALPGF